MLKFWDNRIWIVLGCVGSIHLHVNDALTVITEHRRFSLQPWGTDISSDFFSQKPIFPCLGWALEERTRWNNTDQTDFDSVSQSIQNWQFTVAWSGQSELTIKLPCQCDDEHERMGDDVGPSDSLSTTLWDAGVAGAILCRSPKFIDSYINNKTVLELGSGVGLTGWVAGASAASATLTDHDQRTVQRLNTGAARNPGQVTAQYLEWRDNHNDDNSNSTSSPLGKTSFDLVVATDVAYYYYLLRPLMDTIKFHLGSLAVIAGQANRQSQWDLYDSIKEGCYNQLTDEREEPWPGQTHALLYKLKVGPWTTTTTTDGPVDSLMDDEKNDMVHTIVPVVAIHHTKSVDQVNSDNFLSEWDHVATATDRENILISF